MLKFTLFIALAAVVYADYERTVSMCCVYLRDLWSEFTKWSGIRDDAASAQLSKSLPNQLLLTLCSSLPQSTSAVTMLLISRGFDYYNRKSFAGNGACNVLMFFIIYIFTPCNAPRSIVKTWLMRRVIDYTWGQLSLSAESRRSKLFARAPHQSHIPSGSGESGKRQARSVFPKRQDARKLTTVNGTT